MASTFVNNLRLTELGTGDASGTWGNTTNTNLELIGQALGFGTRAIANASTDNITIADGASDSDRSMYLKLTGGGQACTVTLLPNTVSKLWILENNTNSTLTFTQGSGANVAILAGQTKAIATDGGAGSAIVYEVFTDLNLAGTTTVNDLTVGGDIDLEGDIDVNGTLEADAITLNTVAITATATLDTGISNNNVAKFTSGVADNDFLKVAGTAIEGRSSAEVLSDIGASAVAGSGSIVTTGALNSGSITSGFGTINNGSSAITTTGTITGGALTIDDISINGSTITDAGTMTMTVGALTIDATNDIILDAGGQNIIFKDDGTEFGQIYQSSNHLHLYSAISNADMKLQGNDGGSTITALTLDMSAAGAATFNNDVTAFSDKRLKTDISNIENGLDKVMQMQGVYYKRNDVENAKEQIGVLAQDMEAIMPEVVLTADDEMQTKSVDYGKLTSVLIEAIKELKAEINELKGV